MGHRFTYVLALIVLGAATSVLAQPSATPPAPAPAVYPDFTSGWAQGVREKKLLIVYFRDKSAFSAKADPEWARLRADPLFAQLFLFAESRLPEDAVGMRAAQQLKIEGIPAVSLLVPNTEQLREIDRHEGIYTYDEMRRNIIASMCKASKKERSDVDAWTAFALGCTLRF